MRAYMKNDILNSSYQTQRAETVVFAILGLVGLFAIGLALLASSEFVREKDHVVPARSYKQMATSVPGNAARTAEPGRP